MENLRTNAEHILGRFKDMLPDYSLLTKPVITVRPWPNLDDLLCIEQQHTQDKMWEIISNAMLDNKDRSNEEPINTRYLFFDFNNEYNQREFICFEREHFGDAVLSVTPMGDKPLCDNISRQSFSFISPKDDLIDGEIYAVDVGGVKRAFLRAKIEDGNCPIIELEEFCMLARLKQNDETEIGVIAVFNRSRGILYSDIIHGFPDLADAELESLQ